MGEPKYRMLGTMELSFKLKLKGGLLKKTAWWSGKILKYLNQIYCILSFLLWPYTYLTRDANILAPLRWKKISLIYRITTPSYIDSSLHLNPLAMCLCLTSTKNPLTWLSATYRIQDKNYTLANSTTYKRTRKTSEHCLKFWRVLDKFERLKPVAIQSLTTISK